MSIGDKRRRFVLSFMGVTWCVMPSIVIMGILIFVKMDLWNRDIVQNLNVVKEDIMGAGAGVRLAETIDGIVLSYYSLKFDLTIVGIALAASYMVMLFRHKRLAKTCELSDHRSERIHKGLVMMLSLHCIGCVVIVLAFYFTEDYVCRIPIMLSGRLRQVDFLSSLESQTMKEMVAYVIRRKELLGRLEVTIPLALMVHFVAPYWFYWAELLVMKEPDKVDVKGCLEIIGD